MHITVSRVALRDALALATSVANRKSTIPQLSCALLRADKSLTIAASDLSLTYVTDIECTVRTPGAIALGAKGLYDIVSSLTADEVTIREVDGKGEVRAGKSRFQIGTQPHEHFPKMPDVGALKFVTVDGPALARLVAAVEFCADPADSNLNMQGVFLDLTSGTAMTASRVRCASMTAPLGGKGDGTALVPRASLATMLKAARGVVEVAITQAEVHLRNGKTVISAKVIEADFPITKKIKPRLLRATSDHEVTVPRLAFVDVLKRVMLVSSKEQNHEVLLAFMNGKASLSSKGMGGISEDEMDVGYAGKGYECAVSANQIIEALEAMTSEEASLGFNDSKNDPVMVRPLAEEMGEEHAVSVMPIHRS